MNKDDEKAFYKLFGNTNTLQYKDNQAMCLAFWQAALDYARGEQSRPTRYEVIEHRVNAPDIGRLPKASFDIEYQDGGKTLKVFLKDIKP